MGDFFQHHQHIFFATLYYFPGKYITSGDFDRILLKPVNSLYMVLVDRAEIQSTGSLAVAVIVFIYCVHAGLQITFAGWLLTLLLVLVSAFINLCFHVIAASLAFWVKNFTGVLDVLYDINQYLTYPLNIFPAYLQNLFIYVLPLGFIGYIPAGYILHTRSGAFIWLMPVAAGVFMLLAAYAWKKGLQSYASSGT